MSDYKLRFERGIDVDERTIYIYDDIDSETSFNVQLGLQLIRGTEPIIVNINSFGGSAVDGFCIYEILKLDKRQIVTLNGGCAMSAALLIYMAGDVRLSFKYSEFMYHGPKDYSEFYGADPKNLDIASNQLKVMTKDMATLMAEGSKKEVRFWTTKAKGDFTFKKEEAIKLGIVTKE